MPGPDTGHASWDYTAAADLQRDLLIDDAFWGVAKCHVPILRLGHVGKYRQYTPSSSGIATLDGGSTYSLVEKIGKGGMGEVFRAKDQKLGRDVAITVLPEEFARDTDRVARFQREAKLLASLNHPNIAAIHGLEESEGTNFLVLELVEGQTLADRTAPKPCLT
jgi:serine/threonine protein kinase